MRLWALKTTLLLLSALVTLGSTRGSTPSCEENLYSEYYAEKSFLWRGFMKTRYYSSIIQNDHQPHPTKYILPHIPEDDKLLIVFNGAHVYLHYKDHRIDSLGPGNGIRVYSFVRRSHSAIGSLAFVVYNLSDKTKSYLSETIRNPSTRRALSCVTIACDFLKESSSNTVNGRSWLPSRLAAKLVAAHRKGKPVEIIALNGTSPSSLIHEIRMEESRPLLLIPLVGAPIGLLGYLASLL